MTLPKKLSPNPLISSAIEIKFDSIIDESELIGVLFPRFSEQLPLFKNGTIPPEIRKGNQQLKYSPSFGLYNSNYIVYFGTNVILFENLYDYQLWDNYFSFVKNQLSIFFDTKIIENVIRIGVRYSSILKKEESILSNIPTLNIVGYNDEFDTFHTVIKKDNLNFNLKILSNAKVEKNETTKFGTFIDIDAYISTPMKPNKDIFQLIDKLHLEQKIIFFKLLTETYIQTLNPEY